MTPIITLHTLPARVKAFLTLNYQAFVVLSVLITKHLFSL